MSVTEYSDVMVRMLIERIMVYDEMLVVEFKFGHEIMSKESSRKEDAT